MSGPCSVDRILPFVGDITAMLLALGICLKVKLGIRRIDSCVMVISSGIKNSRSSFKFLKNRQLKALDCKPANRVKGAIVCHSGIALR